VLSHPCEHNSNGGQLPGGLKPEMAFAHAARLRVVYGQTENDAITKVKALCLRVLADRIEHGEAVPEMNELFSVAE
jgi:hypothetical protein